MNERIKKLRQLSLEAINTLSAERALLITEFYQDYLNPDDPVIIQRAKAFLHILRNKELVIVDDEMIIGERGPAPKAVPTYPEVTLHSLEDLDILNNREKVSYKVSPETREIYQNTIIPFWSGKSQREKIMTRMSPVWHMAYEAGIFTEFQEQRTPGHTVAGNKIYKQGLLELLEIDLEYDPGNFTWEEEDLSENPNLSAMQITGLAIIEYALRYAKFLQEKSSEESRSWRIEELKKMAGICKRVPALAPRNLHEALQYYWFMHIGVITESNPWDSFNPGRLDQHLYPFYKKEIEEKSLDEEKVKELLQSFWIKFNNHPAPPKVGVTAQESNTYTDFALINLGGLTEEGEDGVNELSYVLLDVIEEMRILQPSSMIQVSRKNPDEFIQRALKIIQTGFGQPSVFNTDVIIEELTRQGKSLEDARRGGASGCVEAGAFGTEAYILTGYFNLTKVLEITLHNGTDPRTDKLTGIQTGDPKSFRSFSDLLNAFRKQLSYFLEIKMEGNRVIDRLFSENIPVPFLSILIDDCIRNRLEYNSGGARYNTSYIQGVGLGSITDSLTALRYHVFDRKTISISRFLESLENNYKDFPELHHELIFNTPSWGNDSDYADDHAKEVFEMFFHIVDGQPAWKPGSVFRINLLPTTSHVYFGSVIGATPDGRKAGQPLSEGISPVQGRDRHGPTAVLKSASKIDHTKTGGTLLNQKFSPKFFEGKDALERITALIRTYFKLKGHHIQFNVVSAETLREAQKHPQDYRDLIVRVAGYSDYFNDLGKELQDEIIRRTEHGEG
ncbi:MAG: trans-4-hydroxy-L-proline dehydratase [Bacteroidales bacterium]